MPVIDELLSFGIDELYLAAVTDEGDETTPPTYDAELGLIRLRGTSSFEANPVSESYELEGDNGIVDSISKTSGLEISVEYGVLELEHYSRLMGSEIVTATDGSVNLIHRTSDRPGLVGLIGYISSSQSFVICPIARASEISIPHSNLEHAVVSLTLTGIRRRSDNAIKIIKQIDAPRTPTIADFDAPTPAPIV